jgi:hypothetical protein
VEVVRAMVSLLDEALRFDGHGRQCSRIVFGTESCIPIYSRCEIGKRLMASERSWLDAYHVPKNKYEAAHCFQAVDRNTIPSKVTFMYILLDV